MMYYVLIHSISVKYLLYNLQSIDIIRLACRRRLIRCRQINTRGVTQTKFRNYWEALTH